MQQTHRRFADRYPLRVTIVVVLLTLVALALPPPESWPPRSCAAT